MNEIKLPEMVVEKREGQPHNVPAPDLSDKNMSEQVQDALQLNNDAKSYEFRKSLYTHANEMMDKPIDGNPNNTLAWKKTTTDILIKHISTVVPDVTREDIIIACREVLQCNGFDELAAWVRDDMCSEVFNRSLQYCLREGQAHKREKGFIDGSGIGYLKSFLRNLKVNLEKTFDVKYFYKVARPLQYVFDKFGMDLTAIANKIHPGHFSYGQGHSCKSLTTLETLDEIFNLDTHCYRYLLIAELAFGHGRDGNFIHFPMDTYASGPNTKLKEFN